MRSSALKNFSPLITACVVKNFFFPLPLQVRESELRCCSRKLPLEQKPKTMSVFLGGMHGGGHAAMRGNTEMQVCLKLNAFFPPVNLNFVLPQKRLS
jgi:hypothetical protein